MKDQDQINYDRIASAIAYITTNFKRQPDLEEMAAAVNMSTFHFQKLFTDWAGTSPKKFLQYISLAHAKSLLREQQVSLFDAAYHTGLSGTGRLHDLFIKIEGMTPAEYKNGGRCLCIKFDFLTSRFGKLLIASTEKGLCHLAFAEDESFAVEVLKRQFPEAAFQHAPDPLHERAMLAFNRERNELSEIKLHLKGTPFQLKVWEALLRIPMGRLSTYGKIAAQIGQDHASRAVGTAIGSNPIAYLIPCHRVIQSTGAIGGYMWGNIRKMAMIGWEGAALDADFNKHNP